MSFHINVFSFKGPFSCFETRFKRVCDWTGLKFSNDGKHILICTNGGAIRILNSFDGSVLHTFSVRLTTILLHVICFYVGAVTVSSRMFSEFQGYNNSKGVSLEACFTPDSKFVMIGKLPHFRIIFGSFPSTWRMGSSICLVQVQKTGEFTFGTLRVG